MILAMVSRWEEVALYRSVLWDALDINNFYFILLFFFFFLKSDEEAHDNEVT